jgi:glycosyltransferase involved in cell wall biosynthesis
VPYLPHGIEYIPKYQDDVSWARQQLGPHLKRDDRIIGCVATNQPRKDLGLYFQTLVELKERGIPIFGWLHTDVLVKSWSVQELVMVCGLQRQMMVSTGNYSDAQLQALYQACAVTIAPGLGEGFGYPIVESLAAGVPVVHGDYAGGRELIPRREWRFPVREMRLEGIYALQRPVFRAEDVANAIERAWAWQASVGLSVAQDYCRGAVAHLDWPSLWPRWQGWIRQGL